MDKSNEFMAPDAEIIGFTGKRFFPQDVCTSPSPVKILMNAPDWIEKIISCGIAAYRAQLSKKAIDKIVVEMRTIDPVEFTNVQVTFSYLKQKFEDEFVEFHREHDTDFVSEVRAGIIAKNLLRIKTSEASVDDFTNRLLQYFIDKGLRMREETPFARL